MNERVEKIFNLYELVRTKVVEVNDGFIKQFLLDTVKSLNSMRKIGLQFTEIKLHDVFFTTEQTIKIGHIENYYYYKKFLSKGSNRVFIYHSNSALHPCFTICCSIYVNFAAVTWQRSNRKRGRY